MTTQLITTQPMTSRQWLESPDFKTTLKNILPCQISPDRFIRIALTELRKVPKLNDCTPASFIGAILQCGQLGLEIGSSLGHVYLIPFENYKTKKVECQFIIGYRGMIYLARRSGHIISIPRIVNSNDTFEYEYGLEEKLRHIPASSNRGEMTYVYVWTKFGKDGDKFFEVLSYEEVREIMSSSKGSKSGPWQTHFEEMAKKTAIRRLFKYLPVSPELQKAIALDEEAERGEQDNSIIIDQEPITGEPEEKQSMSAKVSDFLEKRNPTPEKNFAVIDDPLEQDHAPQAT